MFVCCECCVLSGRGLCGELITRPEEYYRLWCVVVCDLENSRMGRPWPALCRSARGKKRHGNGDVLIRRPCFRTFSLTPEGRRTWTCKWQWTWIFSFTYLAIYQPIFEYVVAKHPLWTRVIYI